MWFEHCHHCHTTQMFGIRRLVRLDNQSGGVIGLHWSCPACRGINLLPTGSAA